MRRCSRPGLQRHVRVQTRAGAAPQSRPGHHHHVVVHRDTLATVAATYDVPVHALVAVNEHLSTSQTLLPGTIVVIPRLRLDKRLAAEQQRRGAYANAAAAPVRGDARARRQQQAAAPASGRGVSQESLWSDPLVALLALGKSEQTAARPSRNSRTPAPAVAVTQRSVAVPQALVFVPSTGPSLQLCGAAMLLALVATSAERLRVGRRTGDAGGNAAPGAGADVTYSGEAAGLVRLLAPPSTRTAAVEAPTKASGVVEATAVQPAAAVEEGAVATPADALRRQRSASRGLSRKTPAAVSRSRALLRLGEVAAAEALPPASDAALLWQAENAMLEADAGLLPDADSALEELWSAGEAVADEEEDEYEGSEVRELAEELAMMEPFVLEVPPGWAPRVVDVADVELYDEAAKQAAVARITAVIAANLAFLGMLSLVK